MGILLLTSDNHLLVIRRALWTGENPGMIDRPGGHPEPSKIFKFNDPDKPTSEEMKRTYKGTTDTSVPVTFTQMQDGVIKEVGIDRK